MAGVTLYWSARGGRNLLFCDDTKQTFINEIFVQIRFVLTRFQSSDAFSNGLKMMMIRNDFNLRTDNSFLRMGFRELLYFYVIYAQRQRRLLLMVSH